MWKDFPQVEEDFSEKKMIRVTPCREGIILRDEDRERDVDGEPLIPIKEFNLKVGEVASKPPLRSRKSGLEERGDRDEFPSQVRCFF